MATILVVDDQPSNRQFLTMLLGYCGHRTPEASNGAEALQRMREKPPDLVITDVRMPTVDGHELVSRMRNESALAGIPVIFYSAAAYKREARALASSCGVVRLLIKPAEPQLIIQTVNEALGILTASAPVPASILDRVRDHLQLPIDCIDGNAVVFVVDDDRGMRESMSSLMESASLKVQTYAAAEDFLEFGNLDQPSCLVLDIQMPGMSGIDLLENFRSRRVDIPAIVLTGHGDIPAAVRSMKLQVLDFLEKPVDPHILLAKVHQALREDTAGWRERRETEVIRQRIAKVSPRERGLLELLIAGKPSKQIAVDLNISIKTVANHRAHLMAKMHASNAADLVRMSIAAGICPANRAA